MSEGNGSVTLSGMTIEASDAEDLVGRNFTSYWTKWAVMSSRGTSYGWNWPAFFLGPIWMAYRRMHTQAALAVIAWLVASIATLGTSYALSGPDSLPLAFLIAVLSVFSGYAATADGMYFRATWRNTRSETLPGLTRKQSLRAKGGVSAGAATAWAVAATFAWLVPPLLFPAPPAPREQRVTYFSESRFKNPVLMGSLYEQREGTQLSNELRLANALYVKFAADRLNELCGWQPKSVAAVVKGALDVGVGVILTAGTLDTLSRMSEGQADAASKWIQGVSSFDLLRTYARADTDRFLSDNSNCAGPDSQKWAEGVNWYLSAVAPKIVF